MNLLLEVVCGMLVIVVLGACLLVRRISQIVSWRALGMTILATGSLRDCVALIRFCARR
jgi:hypothetical protein